MLRKSLLFYIFLIMANICIFSENGSEETGSLKNTITVDMGLTGSTLLAWGLSGAENPFFGTALQYERHISNKISAAGRLEYRGIGLSPDANMSAFSLEGHGRYYPSGKIFFLDGMLGYALFNYSNESKKSLAHFFKFGGRLGWRIDFGKPGGLVLEPSLGYYWSVGKNNMRNIEEAESWSDFFNQWMNLMQDILIQGYFVGGPQVSLGIGYRF